jgi:DNA replication and repair protein RecF
LDKSQLEAWDTELIRAAIAVDMARSAYFTRLLPVFQNVYSTLGGEAIKKLTLRYDPGWDSALDFASVLSSGLEADLRCGATQNGPHRADIKVQIDKTPAVEFLSRGQQKILVSSLKIAQARILADATGRQSIYLVDDLPSELDKGNRLAVLKMLTQLGGQLFVTSIDLDAITIDVDQIEKAVFHVERGTITT